MPKVGRPCLGRREGQTLPGEGVLTMLAAALSSDRAGNGGDVDSLPTDPRPPTRTAPRPNSATAGR